MPAPEMWTVGRLLQWTTDYLKGRGADSPRLDAEVLLAEALGCKRIELYTAFDQTPKDEQRTAFRELVRRRAEGTPVAYLVGRREFYSLSFKVGPGVLVPRPETELLVVALLDLAKPRRAGTPPADGAAAGELDPRASLAIADVGTGSGVLAVCAAKYLPGARVTAIDASPAALEIAAANAAAHGVAERIEFVNSDLFAALPAQRRFDHILSNPPYVSAAEAATLPREVKDFEPREALVAGPKGTEVIERLIPQAAQRLNPGGHLLIEISPMIHDAVLNLLAAEPRLEPGPTIKDLARLPRVVQGKRRA
jgi:release factor glutamine methyltransferase